MIETAMLPPVSQGYLRIDPQTEITCGGSQVGFCNYVCSEFGFEKDNANLPDAFGRVWVIAIATYIVREPCDVCSKIADERFDYLTILLRFWKKCGVLCSSSDLSPRKPENPPQKSSLF